MNHIKLTNEPLDIKNIAEMASSESCGAVSIFVGSTRDSFEGKRVITLEYEAYQPMAVKQLELICTELRNRWQDIVNIVVFHRLGLVGIGEASVVIAISSPHRETSLNAVETAIKSLKKRVPIWKKEIYEDKRSVWKENNESEVYKDPPNNFNGSMCHVEDSSSFPRQLIQISVCEEEIKSRIKFFVDRKRNEIDLCNAMDFTVIKQIENVHETNLEKMENNDSKSWTCARVNSTVVKQDYSKCHLKVSQVKNNIGPQTSTNYLNTLDKLMVYIKEENDARSEFPCENVGRQVFQSSEEHTSNNHPTMRERLKNIEDQLNIPQNQTKHIFQRLKAIEDLLIYMEAISPEYCHFLIEKCFRTSSCVQVVNLKEMLQSERKTYSISDIEEIIQKFEERKNDHHDVIGMY